MNIKEEYYKWHSPSLDRDIEMLVFGHAGQPVLLFPTSKGAYYQNKDQGMIYAAQWFLENGRVKIYCPDSLDADSWYNKSIPPHARAWNQEKFDRMISTELVPWASMKQVLREWHSPVAVLEVIMLSTQLFDTPTWPAIVFQ